MIKFKKVIGEGFGSLIKETEFKLDRPGLNIVIGDTGDGKTTFFSLVRWVLYGVNLKGVKAVGTWVHKRPKDYKGTIGRVKFLKNGVKYEIIRTLDYTGKVEGGKLKNGIIIKVDGVKSDKRNKGDKQEEIIKIIGYTNELFVNAIIFGQRMKRLIEASGPDKKKVFEEAFEAGFIEEGRIRASKDLKDKKAQFVDIDKKWAISLTEIEAKKNMVEKIEDLRENWEITHKERIKNIRLSIKKWKKVVASDEFDDVKTLLHNERISSLRQELAQLDWSSAERVENEYNLLNRQVKEQEKLIEFQEKTLTRVIEDILKVPTKCSECGQKLKPEAVKEVVKKLKEQKSRLIILKKENYTKLDELKVAFKRKNKELASIIHHKNNRSSLEVQIKKLETELKAREKKENEVEWAKNNIKSLKKDLTREKSLECEIKLGELPRELKDLKKSHKKINKIYKTLKKEIDTLNWVVGDALGNKGLKSYIFDTSLRNLNHRLKYYEQFIGYRTEFMVDFDSANKDIYAVCYQGDNMIMYDDLSGGQNQQVNICTAFAMNDMVSEGKPMNLLVFDEVFENLDAKCTDLVYDLINEKSKDKSLFLITHNLDLQNSGDKVIRVRMDAAGQTYTKWI